MTVTTAQVQVATMQLPRGLPKDYIDTGRMSKDLNDMLNDPLLQYDKTLAKVVPAVTVPQIDPAASNSMKQLTYTKNQDFRLKLADLQKQCDKRKLGITVNLQATQAWDGVEEILRKAVAVRLKDRKKKDEACPMERCLSKMLEYGPGVKSWLEILPDGEYTSLVCGGFKLIIGVWVFLKFCRFILTSSQTVIQLSNVQEEVRDALVRIPAEMQRAIIEKALYAQSVRIQNAFSDFYVAVVNAALEVVNLLLRSKFGQIWRAAMQQDCYGENLRKALEEMEDRGSQFKQEATLCSHQEIREVNTGQAAGRKCYVSRARMADQSVRFCIAE